MADSKRLVATRALRGFADGAVSILLPSYLTVLGLSATRIGIILLGTLFGSALVTLWRVLSPIALDAGGCCLVRARSCWRLVSDLRDNLTFAIFDELVSPERLEKLTFDQIIRYRKLSEKRFAIRVRTRRFDLAAKYAEVVSESDIAGLIASRSGWHSQTVHTSRGDKIGSGTAGRAAGSPD